MAHDHRRARMLSWYLTLGKGAGTALENTATRGESLHMREILAFAVSHGTLTYDELMKSIEDETVSPHSLDLEALSKLACVCGVQNFLPNDTSHALSALRLANKYLSVDGRVLKRAAKLHAELLF